MLHHFFEKRGKTAIGTGINCERKKERKGKNRQNFPLIGWGKEKGRTSDMVAFVLLGGVRKGSKKSARDLLLALSRKGRGKGSRRRFNIDQKEKDKPPLIPEVVKKKGTYLVIGHDFNGKA